MELELKSGPASALFDFALDLQGTLGLTLDTRSKAARGFALLGGDTGAAAPVKIALPPFEPMHTARTVFVAFARACIAQVAGNEKPSCAARIRKAFTS